jgi:predicted ArsR family transcriptional regulator
MALENVSPVDRRLIEIELAEGFVRSISSRWGEKAAEDILAEVIQGAALKTARDMRADRPGQSLAALFEVWKRFSADGRLDLVLDELNETVLRLHVNRCAFAEAYKKRGWEKLGLLCSCRRDIPFAEALLPGVKVNQIRTILAGGERCDYEYRLENGKPGDAG